MSQREFLLLLAHVQFCVSCQRRLLANPNSALAGRYLTDAEKEALGRLAEDDFLTPERLARAMGVSAAELDEYRDHPVARLRHL